MPPASEPQRMQCMEVWGGNVRVTRHFQMPGLDVWVDSRPVGNSAAGGDVYYLSSCASGRITRILLADVSGHGEHVATTAAGLRDLMRANVNVINQRRFMSAMNRQFSAASAAGDFATAVVSSFFSPTRSLSLSSAGHPAPLLFRAAEGHWRFLAATGSPQGVAAPLTDLPLGLVDQVGYQELNVRLDRGDQVLCYTDAFTDARRPDGELLGLQGMLQLVASVSQSGEQDLLSGLLKAILAMHPENLSQDDATLLLFRANGTGTLLRDNLLAPLRLLGKVTDASRIVPWPSRTAASGEASLPRPAHAPQRAPSP